jgi:hypothetical protein
MQMSGHIPISASHAGSAGQPIQIIDITKEHKFKLDEDALKKILSHPKAKYKKVGLIGYRVAAINLDDLGFSF